jgi:hypothetical protein
MTMKSRYIGALVLGLSLVGASLTSICPATAGGNDRWPGTTAGQPTPKIPGVPRELAKNLANFDDLDFRVYTNQQWQDLHKSHSKDVIVHWPDGHQTQGIEKHIEDLKVMFTFAPDNRIKEHPVRFGTADGEWTAVTGWLEGKMKLFCTSRLGRSVSSFGSWKRSRNSRTAVALGGP